MLSRILFSLGLLVSTFNAQATATFDLLTDFGNGRLELGSTQGYFDREGVAYPPVLTDGSPGPIVDFNFEIEGAPPLGLLGFSVDDVLFVEWSISGETLLFRLHAFRERFDAAITGDVTREGLTLVGGAGFLNASDTFCSSIGLAPPSQTAACVELLGGGFDVVVSDPVVSRLVQTVSEPAAALLALGLVGFTWRRRIH